MTTKKHDSQRSRDLGIKHQILKTIEGEERKKSQKSLRSGYKTPNPNVLQGEGKRKKMLIKSDNNLMIIRHCVT